MTGLPEGPYFSGAIGLRDRCHGRYDDGVVPGLLSSCYGGSFGRLHAYE